LRSSNLGENTLPFNHLGTTRKHDFSFVSAEQLQHYNPVVIYDVIIYLNLGNMVSTFKKLEFLSGSWRPKWCSWWWNSRLNMNHINELIISGFQLQTYTYFNLLTVIPIPCITHVIRLYSLKNVFPIFKKRNPNSKIKRYILLF